MTSCSGECCVCACNTCLAGTGDDDFYPAKADQIIRRLEKGEFSSRRQYMIDYLLKMQEKYLIKEIAIDAFRYTIMRDYLDRAGFLYADKRIKFVRPSNIMKVYPLIDRCFANQWFHWDDNPVLRWACNNTKLVRARKSTVTESGDNDIGNFLFGKIEPEARKTDPFMALVASMCFEEDLTDMKIIQEREFIPVFTF